MHAFSVHVVVIDENQQNVEEVNVEAEYYATDADFVTFKDAEHKQIASFNVRNVVSVRRTERKASIGTATVTIVPQLDEPAMQRLVDEIERRAKRVGPFGN